MIRAFGSHPRSLFLIAALGLAPPLQAQLPACSPFLEGSALPILGGAGQRMERMDRLQGGPLRAHAGLLAGADLAPLERCAQRPALGLAPFLLRVVGNSAWPADRYEGALWAGRGLGATFSGGLDLSWKPIRLILVPEVTYQQNRPFRTAESARRLSDLSYRSAIIDWPQRFGYGSFHRVGAGQSRLAVELGGGALGISTENLWLGPALRYPLLLSNSGEGFPHLYLHPPAFHTPIGTVELNLFLGRLTESRYYDSDPSNDYRALSSLSLLIRPSAGFAVGGAVLRHSYSGRIPALADYKAFGQPFSFLRGHDEDDNGLISIFFSWEDPRSGIGLHAEWGREDFFFDLADLVTDPTHSHAWTLGLTRAGTAGPRTFLLALEVTQLSNSAPWYLNGDVTQGHTNRGQLLGAYVGPGSEAQFASLDLVESSGDRWSLEIERVRWDERTYRDDGFLDQFAFRGHDVELRGSLGHGRRIGDLVLDASAGMAWRRNRGFIDLDRWTFEWKPNYELDVSLGWLPLQRP